MRTRGYKAIVRISLMSVLLMAMMVAGLGAAPSSAAKGVTLTVIWHAGGLADLMLEIGKDFTKETGIQIRGDFVPPDQWHDKIATTFAARGSEFDLVIFDSQSMSEFAGGGHVLRLNDFMEKYGPRASEFDPAALRAYAEYPEGSGDYYALPHNQDVLGLVYRKDLFENPAEKAGFKAKYGYELAPPKTWKQLRDIAEFFTRPKQNLYGLAMHLSRGYDAISCTFNSILWSFGGELWDPRTRKITINNEAGIEALTFMKELYKYCPPGSSTWWFDECNTAMQQGLVAMEINWFWFFPGLVDPKSSRIVDKLGFAALPGEYGKDKKYRRYVCLGGQGISISKYSKHPEEAWQFIKWFMQDEIQWRWTVGGAKTGKISVLKNPKFLSATIFNPAFPESMSYAKDFWHVPEYPALLDAQQELLNLAVCGEISPRDALNKIAEKQTEILMRAGYYKK